MIVCQCGPDFHNYVNGIEMKKFVANAKDSKNSPSPWQGRRFRILLSDDAPFWHTGTVHKLSYRPVRRMNSMIADWYLTVSFETATTAAAAAATTNEELIDADSNDYIRLGDYVELYGLNQASMYNGEYGVVISDKNYMETGRYSVQVGEKKDDGTMLTTDSTKKILSVRPKNISKLIVSEDEEKEDDDINEDRKKKISTKKKYWTWKLHRIHPITGGTLLGNKNDCAKLLSLEFLDRPQPPATIEMAMPRVPPSINEQKQWIGTSKYFLLSNGKQHLRYVNDNDLSVEMFAKIQGTNDGYINNNDPWTGTNAKLCGQCPIESFPRVDRLSVPSKKMWPSTDTKKSTYNRIAVDGNFTVEWIHYEKREPKFNMDSRNIQFSFYIDETGPDAQPLRKADILLTFFYKELILSDGTVHMGNFQQNKDQFKTCLDNIQSMYLCVRLTHWILRQKHLITQLKLISIPSLLGQIYNFYVKHKKQKDALDIAIVEADWLWSMGDMELMNDRLQLGEACNRIGEVLESLGRFSEAAKVYSDTGDNIVSSNNGGLYSNAGLASFRADDYENSELHFLKALYYQRDEDVTGANTSTCIGHLVTVYQHWIYAGCSQEITNLVNTFCTLLYAANYYLEDDNYAYVQQIGQLYLPILLKEEFRNRSAGLKIIDSAIQSAITVQDFHNVIMNCKNPKAMAIIFSPIDDFSGNKYKKEKKQELRKQAKEQLRNNINLCQILPSCHHCSIWVKQGLSKCPCDMATYCGKECQAADWKVHKKECTYHNNK